MNTPSPTQSVNNLKQQNNSMLMSIILNVVLPSIVLTKLSSPDWLGPTMAFWLALSFPLSMGFWELVRTRKASFFAFFGLLNVGLTGGLGFLEMDGFWVAVKEAAIPLSLGLGTLISMRTQTPLVRNLLLNETIINMEKINTQLKLTGRHKDFESLINRSSILFACSFFLSAALNFVLARMILKSPTGSPEFNSELGRMTALSFPVIALPVLVFTGFIFWYLFSGISRITMLSRDEIIREQK